VSVAFEVEHVDLLEKAAVELGYRFTRLGNNVTLSDMRGVIKIDLAAGKAIAKDQRTVNDLKRSYSKQAVLLACQAMNWKPMWKTETQAVAAKGGW
jgi:hypothetical protein